MRYGLLVIVIVVGIGLSQGWFTRAFDHVTDAALSADARLAIEMRCQGKSENANRECRAMLKKLFLAGTLDPDRTLRAWCTAVKESRWGGSAPPPPKVCVERYGGWQES